VLCAAVTPEMAGGGGGGGGAERIFEKYSGFVPEFVPPTSESSRHLC